MRVKMTVSCVAVALLVAACGGTDTVDDPSPEEADTTDSGPTEEAETEDRTDETEDDVAIEGSWDLAVNRYTPDTHHYTTVGWEPFIEEVAAATGGAVSIELSPGTQGLGSVSDTLVMLRSGIAGMAESTAGNHAAELPMAQITGAYGWETGLLASQAMWELCNTEPWVSEFMAAGVVPVGCHGTPPYEVFTVGKPIESLEQLFDGLQVRTVGLQGDIVDLLGADATTIPAPELYTSLERGVIDAYSLPRVGPLSLGLEELNEYVTQGLQGWSSGFSFNLISLDVWNEMPPEVQDVLIEQGRELSFRVGQDWDTQKAELVDTGAGLDDTPPVVYDVTDAEREAVVAAADEALERWIAAREGEGLGEEAQMAADAVIRLRDLEPLPVDEWAEFAY